MSDFSSGRAYVPRMIWLLAIPVGASLFPWLVVASNINFDMNDWGVGLLGSVPLVGALAALGYRLVAPEPVRWWPLAPYAVAAAAFLSTLINAMTLTDGDGLELFPVFVIGMVQPVLALGGGLTSFVWISPRRSG